MKKSTLIKLVKEELTKKSLLKEFDTREINRIAILRGALASIGNTANNKSLEPQVLLNMIGKIAAEAIEQDRQAGSGGSAMNEGEEKEYKVEYWYRSGDEKDKTFVKVKATSEEEAIAKAKEATKTESGVMSSSFDVVG